MICVILETFLCHRRLLEGDYDPRFNSPGQGLMPIAEMNNSNTLLKQVLPLVLKFPFFIGA